jgi:hypothetical protein
MFARGFLSLHRAPLSASRKNSANSNYSRTYATPGVGGVPVSWSDRSRNSFVSPTYANTGGCTAPKMSARRHFLPLLSQPFRFLVSHSAPHSFIFPTTLIRCSSNTFRTLSPKTGVYPPWSCQFLLNGPELQNFARLRRRPLRNPRGRRWGGGLAP